VFSVIPFAITLTLPVTVTPAGNIVPCWIVPLPPPLPDLPLPLCPSFALPLSGFPLSLAISAFALDQGMRRERYIVRIRLIPGLEMRGRRVRYRVGRTQNQDWHLLRLLQRHLELVLCR
jgi:hypothetical protein